MIAVLKVLVLLLSVQADGEGEVEAALQKYRKASVDPKPAVRAQAVTELSRVPHERTLKEIVPLLASDTKEVRLAAAKGLGGFQGLKKAAVPSLLGAVGTYPKDGDFEFGLYDALARLQDPAALAAIHKGIKDKHVRTAKAAMAAAGVLRSKESLDVLYSLLQDVEKWIKSKQSGDYHDGGPSGDPAAKRARLDEIHAAIIQALQAITRERWQTLQEWEVWFRRIRPNFEVPM